MDINKLAKDLTGNMIASWEEQLILMKQTEKFLEVLKTIEEKAYYEIKKELSVYGYEITQALTFDKPNWNPLEELSSGWDWALFEEEEKNKINEINETKTYIIKYNDTQKYVTLATLKEILLNKKLASNQYYTIIKNTPKIKKLIEETFSNSEGDRDYSLFNDMKREIQSSINRTQEILNKIQREELNLEEQIRNVLNLITEIEEMFLDELKIELNFYGYDVRQEGDKIYYLNEEINLYPNITNIKDLKIILFDKKFERENYIEEIKNIPIIKNKVKNFSNKKFDIDLINKKSRKVHDRLKELCGEKQIEDQKSTLEKKAKDEIKKNDIAFNIIMAECENVLKNIEETLKEARSLEKEIAKDILIPKKPFRK